MASGRLGQALFRRAPGVIERLPSRVPMARAAGPEEAAQATAWLLSDRASYVNGDVLRVEVGMHAQRRSRPKSGTGAVRRWHRARDRGHGSGCGPSGPARREEPPSDSGIGCSSPSRCRSPSTDPDRRRARSRLDRDESCSRPGPC
ncbi:SDR family oxidoreductase [Streptomyces chartreusis]|uniref:SDR family oxidoreductase n=1 Tax=Streptomyces chartreusis TaxID=1969 RepID=UPI0036C40DA6